MADNRSIRQYKCSKIYSLLPLVLLSLLIWTPSISLAATNPDDGFPSFVRANQHCFKPFAAINGLYAALGAPILPGWIASGGDPCGKAWQGIICNVTDIISITVNAANLEGELGDNLAKFTYKRGIDFSNNRIGGSIPSTLPVTLQHFFLSANQFTGSIPESLGTLTFLNDMSLNDNLLSGELPDVFQNLIRLIDLLSWMETAEVRHDDDIGWFEYVSERAGKVQSETLRRILELNCNVEYLRKWLGTVDVAKLDDWTLETLFTSMVPVVSHADLEPYIQRIADGETSPLLTQEPITVLSLSSGTTEGRQKYVPFTSHSSETTLQTFRLSAAYRSRVYPIRKGGRILEFIYAGKEFKTQGGLRVGTATTHYYASKEFKTKQETTKSFTCSPREVISGGDFGQCTYCHLLLGLHFSDQVEFVASAFSYTIVQAFTFFEEIWREICADIREGNLSSRITLPKMRKAVLSLIRPNTSLASHIEGICIELENLEWFGLIPKLWPNSKYISSIMTGSMLPYLKKLRHYAGGLPLVSADYGSTESWIGVNVDPHLPPEDVSFAVIPTFCYFEFIALYRQNQQNICSDSVRSSNVNYDFVEDKPVPLSQVKLGQEYEVVLTTFTGLYRYRLGDVVEVTGFHKGTPKLSFIYRRKLILTINIDKNTEKDLQRVVDKASQLLLSRTTRAEVVDFTSHGDITGHPGHYIIYWEIRGDADDQILDECCREMDAAFVDHGYVVSRRMNSIGPLELRVVKRGTFGKVAEQFAGKCGGLNQFKTPRCTTNLVMLNILDDCIVKRFRSTAYG